MDAVAMAVDCHWMVAQACAPPIRVGASWLFPLLHLTSLCGVCMSYYKLVVCSATAPAINNLHKLVHGISGFPVETSLFQREV